MNDTIRPAARDAWRAGICLVPPREDGSKRPDGDWKQYQRRKPTSDELAGWFGNGRTGLGGVMGAISGNLELFEFDNLDTYRDFKAAAVAADLGPLIERVEQGYSETTPGGGVHWFYRCAEIAGSTELAKRPLPPDAAGRPRFDVLIETKGEGGYAVLAPPYGRVHPSGEPYRVLAGSFATIATIAPDERRALFDLARSFDETPVREYAPPPARETRRAAGPATSSTPGPTGAPSSPRTAGGRSSPPVPASPTGVGPARTIVGAPRPTTAGTTVSTCSAPRRRSRPSAAIASSARMPFWSTAATSRPRRRP